MAYYVLICYCHSISSPSLTLPTNTTLIIIITSAKEFYVFIGIYLFVCFLVCFFVSRITQKLKPIFTKFVGTVAHGPQTKPLDFVGNPDHITLGLWLWLGGAPRVDNNNNNKTNFSSALVS